MTTTTPEVSAARRLSEARRALGSEWVKDHPRVLEQVYDLTKRMVERLYPWMERWSPRGSERFLAWGERLLKGWIFSCHMCGQCILHSTGMTCPMTCPKKLRNGPCGGVRANEHCEVIAERMCVWVQAWKRSQRMQRYDDEIGHIQPPVDRSLENTSSWANLVTGRDEPPAAWVASQESEARRKEARHE